MKRIKNDKVREAVRKNYGAVAQAGNSGCCPTSSCCSPGGASSVDAVSVQLGYSKEEVSAVPAGPIWVWGVEILRRLPLSSRVRSYSISGAAAGLTAFLPPGLSEKEGKVIGVDMTPEMVSKARENAAKADL